MKLKPSSNGPRPPRVSAVEAQALEALRVALRAVREAEQYLARVAKDGSKEAVHAAGATLACARGTLTEARLDLDLALAE